MPLPRPDLCHSIIYWFTSLDYAALRNWHIIQHNIFDRTISLESTLQTNALQESDQVWYPGETCGYQGKGEAGSMVKQTACRGKLKLRPGMFAYMITASVLPEEPVGHQFRITQGWKLFPTKIVEILGQFPKEPGMVIIPMVFFCENTDRGKFPEVRFHPLHLLQTTDQTGWPNE